MDTTETALMERIRRLCHPLAPLPTGVAARCHALPGLRAVLFDLYGTLLVSGAGDIGIAGDLHRAGALREALEAAEIPAGPAAGERGVQLLVEAIRAWHAWKRARGVDHAEIDIRATWRDVSGVLHREDHLRSALSAAQSAALAVEFECRVNPVWPMPGAREILAALRTRGVEIGLVSNAQFYTPLVCEVLLGKPPGLSVWSFAHGVAKPSELLVQIVLDALRKRHGIPAEQVLYVGNDAVKDVQPAARCGCRTALFAGDQRSFRPAAGVVPDLVITELEQLRECIGG